MTHCLDVSSGSLLCLALSLAALAPAPAARGKVYKSRIQPKWAEDASHFWYRNDLAEGRREFVLVEPEEGTREAAFDHARLADALVEAGKGEVEADRLPLDQLSFDPGRDLAFFRCKGTHFQWNRATHELAPFDPAKIPRVVPPAPPPAPAKKAPLARPYRPRRDVSPDGKWRAEIRDHNLFVRAVEGGEEVQLSRDGEPDNGYQAPYWAPDSNHLVAFRVQPDEVGEVHLVESSPREGGRARLHTRRYALPGDRFRTHELNWFDLAERRQVKPEGGFIDFRGPNLRWTPDGRRFRYEKIDRGHQRFRIIEFDTATGATRNIIDEQTNTFIWTEHAQNLGVPLVSWLERSEEIVYLSEQDGWRHLYLVDIASGTMKQMTRGEFVVRHVDRIDEEKRQVWFRASGLNPGQDPYLVHTYRVNFDGSGFTALTEGNGDHEIKYSPDARYLIDRYSRVDLPPVHELRRVSDGRRVCALETTDIRELEASGWEPPEVFTAKGRDGETDIWGIICRPRDFDPDRKYPVLEDMYAGPHDAYVPKRWSAGRRYASWTDLGFVVVKIDGMGTANRSKAFHDVCWQNLKDAGLPDRIAWHREAARTRPWYDLSRIGIYGGSAGGQSAAGALLFHPEFYHAAVASCGCHDNRMDKASWNEQWMGYPVGPHYAASSNIDNAHRLRGRLLLIVGEMDTNVPPESTLRLASALVSANKDFDLVLAPGVGHGGGGRHGQRRRVDFFREHLQGIQPPDHNAESP